MVQKWDVTAFWVDIREVELAGSGDRSDLDYEEEWLRKAPRLMA